MNALFNSPVLNWVMTAVSLIMLAEYTRIVLTVDNSPRKTYVLIAWAFMLVICLATAIYKTWLRKGKS